MRVRSYAIHWRRLAWMLPAYLGWSWHQTWRERWLQLNLWMILALLISIRRADRGLHDD